jgi:hypothetical protein
MKYELVHDDTIEYDGHKLTRIRAIRDIKQHNVRAGDLGGYVLGDLSLSQEGDHWIHEGFVCYFLPPVTKSIC